MEVLWRSEQQWNEKEGMQEDKGGGRVAEGGWCWLDGTTLPEKDKVSPQNLQREAQGGQVSEEGNGIV